MRVRWGQAGSDFQLQNGLMQFVLLILSLMLGCTPARTKRSQNAKVDFNCVFENYLTDIEISAFSDRINMLIASGTFPLPSDEWPAIPWPPV